MGLLDDAIRDHLELKRRHGADPGEVARIENEALSAARREAPPAAAGVEDAVAEDDELFDLEDDPLADLPYRDAEPDEDAADDVAIAEAPVHHREPEPEAVYEHELADVEPEPEPDPAARPTSPRTTRRPPSSSRWRSSRPRRRATTPRPASRARARPRPTRRRRARRGGRARGDARVPAGDARARPSLVRAEAAEGLRLLGSSRRAADAPLGQQ